MGASSEFELRGDDTDIHFLARYVPCTTWEIRAYSTCLAPHTGRRLRTLPIWCTISLNSVSMSGVTYMEPVFPPPFTRPHVNGARHPFLSKAFSSLSFRPSSFTSPGALQCSTHHSLPQILK
ncbi:unnamed protein product [Cyclocybe aegerita]|uniref:Uncharacterized protein n=1 Tax=Cyclocybe aegerita TaxID=1973307 RepID=A0A8S0XZI2_CYCAE|nr:unnamed protein product [Cyclocybe aegerita]